MRHMTTTFYHITGSCKMAPPSDPYGVVDHKLRSVEEEEGWGDCALCGDRLCWGR